MQSFGQGQISVQYSVYDGSYTYTAGTSSNSFDNYIYVKNIHAQTYIRWECNKRWYENCKAGIKTDLQMMNPIHFGEHCHPPNEIEVKMKKIERR